MPQIIYIDEAQLNREFEDTLDQQWLTWHNHQTRIPKGLTGELVNVDLKATGRSWPNGIPPGWIQDEEAFERYKANNKQSGFWVGFSIILFVSLCLAAFWALYKIGIQYPGF